MPFNQEENLRSAIGKDKDRIDEIRDQLSRPGGTAGSRLQLRAKARQLEQANVERLAALDRLTTAQTKPVTARSLNYRSPLKRAIAFGLIRDDRASYLQLCTWLDEDGAADLPANLQKHGNRSFVVAYRDRDFKHRIESIISKVRGDMRAKGV
jgi:hypothetical protein